MADSTLCAKADPASGALSIDTSTTDLTQCQYLLMTPDPAVQFAVLGITNAVVQEDFALGFWGVFGIFVFGLAIRAATDAVKRL